MPIITCPPMRDAIPIFEGKWALKQDNWNDYSFRTLYHLYYQGEGAKAELVGPVKILKQGQIADNVILITEPFDQLTPDFCSVGGTLDYYERLHAMDAKDREYILRALNDVVAFPDLQANFRDEKGWEMSLWRDGKDSGEFLTDADAMLSGDYSRLAKLDTELTFHPGGWNTSIELDFTAPKGKQRNTDNPFLPPPHSYGLPNRTIVVIGRNGSGKSTLLAKLAHVAFASPDERETDQVRAFGKLAPPSIGFTRIITISYSAFDSFVVPGASMDERSRLASDIARGAGRYVYAGLRDIALEAQEATENQAPPPPQAGAPVAPLAIERKASTRLKNLGQLAQEFEQLLTTIRKNGDFELLALALRPVLRESSFLDLEEKSLEALVGDYPAQAFLRWSTGHKIVMHVVASLLANAKHRSLVLFDEPETHLHPPLVAALMHAVRLVLDRKNAFAVVATHSPVVLQETLAKHVRVVERIESDFNVTQPLQETFGENVGILTYDTFRLTGEATDFHNALDQLIKAYNLVEEINVFFTPALSGQALGYVMAGLAKKSRAQ